MASLDADQIKEATVSMGMDFVGSVVKNKPLDWKIPEDLKGAIHAIFVNIIRKNDDMTVMKERIYTRCWIQYAIHVLNHGENPVIRDFVDELTDGLIKV
jgi:hypothetical protein